MGLDILLHSLRRDTNSNTLSQEKPEVVGSNPAFVGSRSRWPRCSSVVEHGSKEKCLDSGQKNLSKGGSRYEAPKIAVNF